MLDQINQAIQGKRIHPGDWGVQYIDGRWEQTGFFCPLGALLFEVNPNDADPEYAAAEILGVSLEWVIGFTHGFDGAMFHKYLNMDDLYNEGYTLGRQYREATCQS